MTSAPEVDPIELHVVDYVIFGVSLVVSIGIGLFFSFRGGGQKTNSEFFMGSRKLRTVPVAVSALFSILSGVFVLGHSAEMYVYGNYANIKLLTSNPIACALVTVLFVPVFYRLRVTSAFEYLEARFQSKFLKLLGTSTALLNMLLQMGVVLFAPAVALQAFNGIPVWMSIVVTASVATLYTALGGMKAVVYTDVFQALCMTAGLFAIIVKGTLQVGGIKRVWDVNLRDGRLSIFSFDPDPRVRVTFWSTISGTLCATLHLYGINQTSVQRFCALPTVAQAKRSVWLMIPLMSFATLTVSAAGFVVYAYYADTGCDPIRARLIRSQSQLLPYFIRTVLNFPGIPGAFLAVIFAGALSTVSSQLNSSAAIFWQDILKYFLEKTPEGRRTIVTRTLVLLFGAVGIGVAFLVKFMSGHVMQAMITISGIFSGPMVGLFLLGILLPYSNVKGAIVGLSIGVIINAWIAVGNIVYIPTTKGLPTSIDNCSTNLSTVQSLNNTTYGLNETSFLSNSTWTNDDLYSLDQNMTASANNMPIESHRWSDVNPLLYLYSISFNLYPLIGFLNTFIVGIVVSLLTGGHPKEVDRQLIVPVFDRLISRCLPETVRQSRTPRAMHCPADGGKGEDGKTSTDVAGGSSPPVANQNGVDHETENCEIVQIKSPKEEILLLDDISWKT